jgi:tryptophanyl-tRNA synthetase
MMAHKHNTDEATVTDETERTDEEILAAMVAAGVDVGHDEVAMQSLAPIVFAMIKAYHG